MPNAVDKNALYHRALWGRFGVAYVCALLADVRLFAIELILLMVLLVLGTLAQAKLGLFAAQKLFFESWFWLAGGVLPMPGMKLVLAFVVVGLVIRLAREPLTLARTPVWLVHAGVILLLAGSSVVNWKHIEGYMLLAEGETSDILWQAPEGNATESSPADWKNGGQLPFRVTLQRFIKEFHPGTDMARRYQSDVVIGNAKGDKTPSAIAMNQPLRYEGWAVYQASYWVDDKGRDVSVLAVVQNKGRMVPYLAGLVVALGMMGVLFQRFMRWRKMALAVVMLLTVMAGAVQAEAPRPAVAPMPMAAFGQIPILHNGRVKPMETFADDVALRIAGTRTPNGTESLTWLANIVFTPAQMTDVPMVNVADPNTAALLGVPWRMPHRYSLVELIPALQKQAKLIQELEQRDDTPDAGKAKPVKGTEAELLAVYRRVQEVVTLGRTFSLVMPLFVVRDDALAARLGLTAGAPFNYTTLMALRPRYMPLLEDVMRRNGQRLTSADKDLLGLAFQARLMADDRKSALFRVLPPVWESAQGEWVSPWQSYESGLGGPEHVRRLALWQKMQQAWMGRRAVVFSAAVTALSSPPTGGTVPADAWPPRWKMQLEGLLNRFQPFTLAMLLALGTAACVAVAAFGRARALWLALASSAALCAGVALLAGMAARVALLGRPPVATLYESVLFVAVTTLFAGIWVAFLRRDGGLLGLVGLLVAGLMGIAHWQAGQGDTLGMVLAVLNTRFWLTTHVLTITGGYGVCLLLAGSAHALLLREVWALRRLKRPFLTRKHEQGVLILTVLALFLTAAGTVLGGVWADQSWGRFWGWDPKENGALLIVLWLTMVLHLRLAGWVSVVGFLAGCAATTVIVAISWFGVNLLNVGLHSYGFTSGLAEGLGLFVAGQLGVLGLLAWGVRQRGATHVA